MLAGYIHDSSLWFLRYSNLERISWRACKILVKQPPGPKTLAGLYLWKRCLLWIRLRAPHPPPPNIFNTKRSLTDEISCSDRFVCVPSQWVMTSRYNVTSLQTQYDPCSSKLGRTLWLMTDSWCFTITNHIHVTADTISSMFVLTNGCCAHFTLFLTECSRAISDLYFVAHHSQSGGNRASQ